jgi:multidrug efflux pump subunit AcrA (membrane-fusion protein)
MNSMAMSFSRLKKGVLSCLVFAGLLPAFLTGCGQQERKKTPKVQQMREVVEKSNVSSSLYFGGVISPLSQSAVSTPSNGVVKEMLFSYGQAVKEGDLMFVLQSAQLQKDYDTALTNYLKAKDTLSVAESKFVGTLELWKAGLIPRNTFESEQSALSTARISLYQAQQVLELLLKQSEIERELDVLKNLKISDTQKVERALSRNLNRIELKAKRNGIVLKPPSSGQSSEDKKIQVGSQVKDSEVLALIGDLSGLAINITVSEIDIDKIHPGMKAVVQSVAYPELNIDAVVEQVSSQASSVSGLSGGLPTFQARIVVPRLQEESQKKIKVGMSAKVQLKTDAKEALLVNVNAVYQKNGQNMVNVAKKGAIEERTVTTGRVELDKVIILEGLEAGETVVWDEMDSLQ